MSAKTTEALSQGEAFSLRPRKAKSFTEPSKPFGGSFCLSHLPNAGAHSRLETKFTAVLSSRWAMRSQARLLMPWSCFGKSWRWCGASERLRLSRRKRESPCRCERSFSGFDSYAMPSIANWRLLAVSSIHGFDRFFPSRRKATTTIPGFPRPQNSTTKSASGFVKPMDRRINCRRSQPNPKSFRCQVLLMRSVLVSARVYGRCWARPSYNSVLTARDSDSERR